jgi:hypothetical protein
MAIACPSCGADVEFRSAQSVFAVCPFCRSSLVRRDVDLEIIGKMAELRADSSPLQIGTSGKIDGRAFTLAGRLKLGWERGFWLEWLAIQDDGSYAWIAEAQGFWMISREIHLPNARLPALSELSPGARVALGTRHYVVDDIKKTTCLFSEGELPFPAPLGRMAATADLVTEKGAFASLDYSPEGLAVYEGRYAEFAEFGFHGLRELDGWR